MDILLVDQPDTCTVALDGSDLVLHQGALGGWRTTIMGAGDDSVFATVAMDLHIVDLGEDGQNDAILFGGKNEVYGGSGDETVMTGSGYDYVVVGAGDDIVTSGGGPDHLHLGPGNDIACGSTGPDVIYGDEGNDTLLGGAGNERLVGGSGDDLVMGGLGHDVIEPGSGVDVVHGGAGDDEVLIHDLCELDGNKLLDGGLGYDRLILPVTMEEAVSMGVQIVSFEEIEVARRSCRSECVTQPSCGRFGRCSNGPKPGVAVCDCMPGYTGPQCQTLDPDVSVPTIRDLGPHPRVLSAAVELPDGAPNAPDVRLEWLQHKFGGDENGDIRVLVVNEMAESARFSVAFEIRTDTGETVPGDFPRFGLGSTRNSTRRISLRELAPAFASGEISASLVVYGEQGRTVGTVQIPPIGFNTIPNGTGVHYEFQP